MKLPRLVLHVAMGWYHSLVLSVGQYVGTQLSKLESCRLNMDVLYMGTSGLSIHFRVMERIGKTVYRLDLKVRFKDVHNIFHVSQLKKHLPGGSSANPTEPIQVEGEEHFEVEALLQYRSRGNSW